MEMEIDVDDQASNAPNCHDVRQLLWGDHVREDLFIRWSQGFTFSPDESIALIQKEGGPCGIIAPVQAFLLKAILSDESYLKEDIWRHLPPDKVDEIFCRALTEILHQAAIADSPPQEDNSPSSSKLLQLKTYQESNEGSEAAKPAPAAASAEEKKNPQYCLVFLKEPLSSRVAEANSDTNLTDGSVKYRKPENELFHRNLRLLHLENISQVEKVLREKIEELKGYYGILQFLYSVILTRGLENLKCEMSEVSELIDPVHGHGSQSLINLMLTGHGVSYVWDNEQDVGGLKLKGIVQQGVVGFLTLLERLRYCEVGSFLKNPKYPVWVVGSETHLTVLFSTNMNLVCPETPGEMARRVFKTFDPEGNNFITAVLLEDVMRTLDLFADSEYVDLMRKKLDPEGLSIILLNDFLDEFFPEERSKGPDTFTLFHYNGLPRSSSNRKVTFQEGKAILLETEMRSLSEDNMILTCLQTKWPSIDIQWINGQCPSIN